MTAPSDVPRILPLELDDVCFEAGGNRLIKDVTLRLEPGLKTAPAKAYSSGSVTACCARPKAASAGNRKPAPAVIRRWSSSAR